MKTEKKPKQKTLVNHLFSEHYINKRETSTEIYRMIYFLNKIEGPCLLNLFKKYKIQFTGADSPRDNIERDHKVSNDFYSLN